VEYLFHGAVNVKFVNDYTKKFNHAPDQFAAQAFAGVHIAYQAAKASGGGTIEGAATSWPRPRTRYRVGPFSFTEGRDGATPA
jgi:branched-chain amino acid transport system substrate-binding protein